MARWFTRSVIITTCVLALGLPGATGSPAAQAHVRDTMRFQFPHSYTHRTARPCPRAAIISFRRTVRERSGYLWSFVQGGAIVWENCIHGTFSSNTYIIKIGSPAYRRRGGVLQVWVRAALPNAQWKGQYAHGDVHRPQSPAASGGPNAIPGSRVPVLYQAGWSHGLRAGLAQDGRVWWFAGADGSSGQIPILAPCRPGSPNYVVRLRCE